MTFRIPMAAAACVALLSALPAAANDLTIGVFYDPQTVDPHVRAISGSNQVFEHIYSSLIFRNKDIELEPALAESWKLVDDKTWEIKLRKDVKWHDGSPFTADDVLFTVERSPNPPGAVSSMGRFLVQNGKQWKKIDDHTLQISTPKPYPNMPRDLSVTHMISKRAAQGASTADFDSGKAAIGTGPYKFVEYVRGDRVVLKANPDWFRGKPKWDNVTLKVISSNPTRIAALVSGAVDVIDAVSPEDLDSLKKNPRVAVHSTTTNRVVLLWVDAGKDVTPKIKAVDGKDLFPNPLRDWRVRKAISKAIDRKAMVERVMEGTAEPASQFKAPGHSGHNPALKPEGFDPEGAKKLLAEAGYPNGFKLQLNASDIVSINALKVAEAVVQMLNRVGIQAELETIPGQAYWGRMRTGEYSLALGSWMSSNGAPGDPLLNALHTFWPADNMGVANFFWYSNRRLDEAIGGFVNEMDPNAYVQKIHAAYDIATRDLPYIPIHWEVGVYASKPDIVYEVRRDLYTLAESASKKR